MINPYITLDGHKYAIAQGSYLRRWIRSFTSFLSANIVRLNFIDKGPGVRTYSMQLSLSNWPPGELLYNAGITESPETAMANLETTYAKVATPVAFTDPFGSALADGVYVTDLQQVIPSRATSQESFILVTIELTEATSQTVN